MPVQKPTAKKTPVKKNPLESIQADAQAFFDEWKKKACDWGRQFEKFRDIIKNNYELGISHLGRGNVQDAIMRFKFVVWMEPKHAAAWYYLGASYLADDKPKPAQAAFKKALALKPTDEKAMYMLAIATGGTFPASKMPKKMPLELAIEHFDSIAATYNKEQVDGLKYSGHTILANTLHAAIMPGRMDHIVLELGVGTGLCGPLVNDITTHLTGVDISPEMLAEAVKNLDSNGGKIYNSLIKRDLQDFINDAMVDSYDIVMAASTLSFIGDLSPVFPQVARILKAGGLFAFTVDKTEIDGYEFNAIAARYRYSRTYLEQLAQDNGLKEIKFKEVEIYPQYLAWVCVFQK